MRAESRSGSLNARRRSRTARGHVLRVGALVIAAGLAASPAAADAPATADSSADLASIGRLSCLVLDEIGLIREEMGRPADTRPAPTLTGARPRDAHALAATLLVRANRLMFERTSELADDVVGGEGRGVEVVHALLDAAFARLAVVKASLEVPEEVAVPEGTPIPSSWSTIATELLRANRQLDLLLDERIASREVFERITEAVGHAARLVTAVTGQAGLPDPPGYERRRRPEDVCERLLTCLELVRRIERSPIVRVETPDGAFARATPGDAYDLAAIVAARVASLHARSAGVQPPLPTYYPGPRLPSHAYQRAGILELQLAELERHRAEYTERLAPAGRDAG